MAPVDHYLIKKNAKYSVILVDKNSDQIVFEGSEKDCERWIKSHQNG